MNTYNLNSWIINTIKKNNIKEWTPIQDKVLSSLSKEKNIIGISPTGTGKTLAYVLPILQKIDINLKSCQSIIVCPTRELARQVFNVFKDFRQSQEDLKIKLWIGGLDLNKLINEAKNQFAHIIICTPQRFLEVSSELPSKTFEHVNTFVLDEADMLLDLNFYPQIYKITEKLNFSEVTKFAFSATLHDVLNHELIKLFKNIYVINLNNIDILMKKINHYIIKTHDKNHALSVLLNQINPYFCLIFTNTKQKADEIYKLLLEQNYNVINLHSGLSTRARKNNYKNIKNQKYQYVVASDLFSRGLDIDGASHIINYDIPDSPEWYIHRAGRTGRGKYNGESYVIYKTSDQKNLEKIINKKIVFKTKQIKNNELVDAKLNLHTNKFVNHEQEKEIKKVVSTNSKVVKPGYKKKLKSKIKKIKQKYKREHIEKLVKNKRLEKYRNQENN